ncbi:MAG TPA: DUF59 domain-containing protein [Candidatus Sphingobacterium stercoripullorum]|uniref:DUF59 domain-containing protein n=1 Tax=Candidatus Sphingobacterium stercoripullorum TaxID=2838759 RepID=A0A9D1W9K8_9SPHI|nr:DUF59 domain-containing protein [Candidatus Sphingobacterium stercoripullorum]
MSNIIIRDELGIKDQIIETLHTVIDPELEPASIVDIGLVYEIITKEDGTSKVIMTLTAPACPVAGQLMEEVQQKIGKLDKVKKSLVELTFEPPWTKDMMSEEAKLMLGLF